ncbi:hypothetical protein BpHYR1_017219 [Brachionus plicatilis]|uniref:Uncharacterized protein n=1 Tax=Brachionus plicatilis TaxID=10195 RepID=A0A3M7QRH8_BRAPC|nr:hypothetical protein BpHYR1_017219 [Brachionus plicatilis]
MTGLAVKSEIALRPWLELNVGGMKVEISLVWMSKNLKIEPHINFIKLTGFLCRLAQDSALKVPSFSEISLLFTFISDLSILCFYFTWFLQKFVIVHDPYFGCPGSNLAVKNCV